jgi:hypothetical protein
MSTAMTSALQIEEFRRIWIEKFTEQASLQGGPPQGDAWEGFDAYRELNAKNNLWLVMPSADPGDSFFSLLTEKLAREVHIYKTYKTSVVADNQSFRDAIDTLSSAEEVLNEAMARKPTFDAAKSKVKTELDKRMRECASAIQENRRSLELWRDSYWKDVLFAPPEERMKWSLYFDDKNQLQTIAPDELVEWEKIFDNAIYPKDLVKQIDLDTRFQLRVAVILRHYLHKVDISLRTISRLAVLTYICGGLCVEDAENIILDLDGKKRTLAVGGIDQKLRAAGMR